MNVCILGDGLVSLTLAKTLVNKGIYVDIFVDQKKNKINKSRTLGISKDNIEFLNKNVLNINKLLWKINKIEIYTEKLKDQKILDFNDKELFSIVKNHELYNRLISSLNKNVYFKKKINFKPSLSKNYDLVINCDLKNFFAKKYFNKRINKKYKSHAFTTIIEHQKIKKNNTAIQIFTNNGPLAFLPISEKKTSIVYSIKGSKNIDLKSLIHKHNIKYKNIKIDEISNIELSATNLRKYYFENILAFGDLLHRVHPLAGQGFNMSIRDINLLNDLIEFKLNHGLELDKSICSDFEKKIKHKNFIFSSGIDFVYEFFNFESKLDNSILTKSIKILGSYKPVNQLFTKLADKGLTI